MLELLQLLNMDHICHAILFFQGVHKLARVIGNLRTIQVEKEEDRLKDGENISL